MEDTNMEDTNMTETLGGSEYLGGADNLETLGGSEYLGGDDFGNANDLKNGGSCCGSTLGGQFSGGDYSGGGNGIEQFIKNNDKTITTIFSYIILFTILLVIIYFHTKNFKTSQILSYVALSLQGVFILYLCFTQSLYFKNT